MSYFIPFFNRLCQKNFDFGEFSEVFPYLILK